jgi:hypothetical protein
MQRVATDGGYRVEDRPCYDAAVVRKKVLNLPDEVRAYFRAAAERRQRVSAPCQFCGQMMENVLPTRRYCSESCHSKAAYRRRRGNQRAQEPPGGAADG